MKYTLFLLLFLLSCGGADETQITPHQLDSLRAKLPGYKDTTSTVTVQLSTPPMTKSFHYATQDNVRFYPREVSIEVRDTTFLIITPSSKLEYIIDYTTDNGYSIHRKPDGWNEGPYIESVTVTHLTDGIRIGNYSFYHEIPVKANKKVSRQYTVVKGDTYFSISRKTGIPVERLKTLLPKVITGKKFQNE